jgi:hypothetical protein
MHHGRLGRPAVQLKDLRRTGALRFRRARPPLPHRSSDARSFISLRRSAKYIIALISGTAVVSRKEAAWHESAYFFRKRFALAIARECQGARSEVIVALPRPETSRAADLATASAFSFAIRRYSAGEQSLCKIKKDRREIVSQDASIRSLIITASDNPWRCLRLRPFITEAFW